MGSEPSPLAPGGTPFGRRGGQSRFVWAYSLISLGKVAAGETEDIEEVYDSIPEAEDQDPQTNDRHLTIPEAKRVLAKSLGVEPDQIVIEIRT